VEKVREYRKEERLEVQKLETRRISRREGGEEDRYRYSTGELNSR